MRLRWFIIAILAAGSPALAHGPEVPGHPSVYAPPPGAEVGVIQISASPLTSWIPEARLLARRAGTSLPGETAAYQVGPSSRVMVGTLQSPVSGGLFESQMQGALLKTHLETGGTVSMFAGDVLRGNVADPSCPQAAGFLWETDNAPCRTGLTAFVVQGGGTSSAVAQAHVQLSGKEVAWRLETALASTTDGIGGSDQGSRVCSLLTYAHRDTQGSLSWERTTSQFVLSDGGVRPDNEEVQARLSLPVSRQVRLDVGFQARHDNVDGRSTTTTFETNPTACLEVRLPSVTVALSDSLYQDDIVEARQETTLRLALNRPVHISRWAIAPSVSMSRSAAWGTMEQGHGTALGLELAGKSPDGTGVVLRLAGSGWDSTVCSWVHNMAGFSVRRTTGNSRFGLDVNVLQDRTGAGDQGTLTGQLWWNARW